MSFNLFGFDFSRSGSTYGFWMGEITTLSGQQRSLLCIHRAEGEIMVEIMYLRLI